MDFTLDADQLALQEVARQALSREIDGQLLRELADDPTGMTPELWGSLVDLGWTGMLVPEWHGGAGTGLTEMCIVLEQMGRVPLPGPFWSSAVLATLAARALGAEELLSGLSSGEVRGTVALQELAHGDPLASVRSRARRKGAGWVVSGHKPLVPDGHTADWMIVVARGEEGVRSFLLESPAQADIVSVPTLDPTRKAARVVLEEHPVRPLGPPGNQLLLWRRVLDDVAVSLASDTVGVADRALELAISYSKERIVFDRPIASFQVAKHKMVDMYQMLEMARVGAQFAAWASDTEAPERARAAAMAASYASEAGVKVTGDDIQLHGGMGFTWANDAHFLYKRAKQNEILLGGASHERHRLARMLVESA
jgi:alkylation response protein AidB-like acyl-CoA dehydrogenase